MTFFLISLIGIPAVMVLGLEVERLSGADSPKSARFNAFCGFFQLIVTQLFGASVAPGVVWLAGVFTHPLIYLPGKGWWFPVSVLLVHSLLDLVEYFFHRLQHKIPWLWAMHSFHHSDSAMNATTAFRNFWLDRVIRTACFVPVGFLFHTTATVMLCVMVTGWFMAVFQHMNIRVGHSRLIVTPQYHRTHHSILQEHYDRNFAEFLPLWDVIFGTYIKPDGFPPTGLTEGEPRSIKEAFLWSFKSHG